MDLMEQRKDAYFNYLVKEMMKALSEAKGYDCVDFELMRIDLILNLNHFLSNRNEYNERIKVLSKNENQVRYTKI